jgi:hypothetical protein
MSAGWMSIIGGMLMAFLAALSLAGGSGHTERLIRWHAFFWDPWLLLVGLLMTVALYRSAQAAVAQGHELY